MATAHPEVTRFAVPTRPPQQRSRAVEMLRVTQHALFAAVVFVGFVKGLVGESPVTTTLLALVLAVWYVLGTYLERAHRTKPMAVLWLAVLTVLCVVAVLLSSDFAWVSFALFVLYASILPAQWAYTSIGLLALVVGAVLATRWPGDRHWLAQFVGPLIGAAVAGALVSVYRMAATESRERQELIDELLIAQDDLARANLDAGVRSERERVAAEIHDTLAQGFASTVLLGRRALRSLDAGDLVAVEGTLDELVRIGSVGLDDARRLVRNLPPQELQGSALADALGVLVARAGERVGERLSLRIDGEPRLLPQPIETALLRVAGEGIANAVNHSGADRIVVTLTYRPDEVSLDVVDNGAGFAASDRRSARNERGVGGFGLGVMAKRIEDVGGSFSIESSPGSGTAVAACIPLDAAGVSEESVAGRAMDPDPSSSPVGEGL